MFDEKVASEIEKYLERKNPNEFYPSKFAKGAFTIHDVIEFVEERDDIERVYKVLCPKCRMELKESSYLANLISRELECDNCDMEFKPDHTQVIVAYRKQG